MQWFFGLLLKVQTGVWYWNKFTLNPLPESANIPAFLKRMWFNCMSKWAHREWLNVHIRNSALDSAIVRPGESNYCRCLSPLYCNNLIVTTVKALTMANETSTFTIQTNHQKLKLFILKHMLKLIYLPINYTTKRNSTICVN